MACNTPSIASFDTNSDSMDVIRDSRIAVCVESENADLLVIWEYRNNETDQKSDLREYIWCHPDKKMCVPLYIESNF